MSTAVQVETTTQTDVAWRGFTPGAWQRRVNVREFIQRNYTPYEGDSQFLQGPTARTRDLWQRLLPLLATEREKGVVDVSQVPSSILAHDPGYIDKEREIIVGLQTDAPLKRAIMPLGGWRVVESSLKGYGYTPDPALVEIFTKYRKTHNAGVFDAYTPDIRKARSSHVVTGQSLMTAKSLLRMHSAAWRPAISWSTVCGTQPLPVAVKAVVSPASIAGCRSATMCA